MIIGSFAAATEANWTINQICRIDASALFCNYPSLITFRFPPRHVGIWANW